MSKRRVACLKTGALWFCTAIFLLAAERADAGGIEVPDLGAVSLGRGTAFVAKADNLSAFYYNPAGLSKSKGPNLILGANLGNLNVRVDRTGGAPYARDVYGTPVTIDRPEHDYYWADITDPSDPNYFPIDDPPDFSTSSQQGALGISSANLVFSWGDPGGVKGLAVAVGLITPSGYGSSEYSSSGSQRYVLNHANQLIVYPGVGLSYAVNRYFQIGAVFLSGIADIKLNKAARFTVVDGQTYHNENKNGDAVFDIEVKDMFMPTGIFGVLSNPTDWIELGVSVKLPTYMKSTGTAVLAKAPAGNSGAFLEEDKIGINLTLPLVVRAGVRYIHRVFDIEVDYVFENWSVLDEIEVNSDLKIVETETNIVTEFNDTTVPLHYRDTHSVRLGGDVKVLPEHLIVRAGAYWQSSAYPEDNRTFSVFAPFGQQVGVGGGLTWHTSKWLDVHVAYLHVFQQDVTVEQGVVQQMAQSRVYTNPEDDTETTQVENGNVVNEGKYEVNMNMIALSLEGHF